VFFLGERAEIRSSPSCALQSKKAGARFMGSLGKEEEEEEEEGERTIK